MNLGDVREGEKSFHMLLLEVVDRMMEVSEYVYREDLAREEKMAIIAALNHAADNCAELKRLLDLPRN